MEWQKGESRWRQIERVLLQDIVEGRFQQGDKLPTEHQLAERFGVNRHTVRSALASLVDGNVIRVEQGRGAFVQEKVLSYPLDARPRFSQVISNLHRMPNRRLLSDRIEKATKKVAKSLGVQTGTKVIVLETLSEADGVPLSYGLSYLPEKKFSGIASIYQNTKSLTKALKEFGVDDFTRKSTFVMAQMPTSAVASHLKQVKNKPILMTESVDIDSKGVPVEFGVTSFASERVQLLVES